MNRWHWLVHNVVVHPVCGLLWFTHVKYLGKVADFLHEVTAPDDEA